ncbi:hypothetical protein [Terribacillus saccharophilus]|uniref:Uncharacterized protein n=1 Tax=Terribacillus saccharophilus TaxID=361277 RepID=A0A268ADY2_9BACI|nr:hypothetical protein [Terribacillus saccharophilus]PAD22321.1 hypothetical protein CHH64_01000 [Terribacillus saccharophilus]PAF19056.1 hypothetical protein CHH51_05005 [Terribacillus saccharophilus]PAF23221.1 hypothetical protein CHH49_01300 [Terribacillus saccharophilus]PAF36905.1 hypothetical protein CHH58_08630 [Terribacillus saccharophilus]PAF39632.1 hypothetical protein CHH69_06925 [Terribacillus saccharophilus]
MAKEYKYQDGSYMETAQSNRENDNKDSNKDKNNDCQVCCVGGTRWGGSFLSPQDPPFPPYL